MTPRQWRSLFWNTNKFKITKYNIKCCIPLESSYYELYEYTTNSIFSKTQMFSLLFLLVLNINSCSIEVIKIFASTYPHEWYKSTQAVLVSFQIRSERFTDNNINFERTGHTSLLIEYILWPSHIFLVYRIWQRKWAYT